MNDPAEDTNQGKTVEQHLPYTVETLSNGLDVPWEMAVAENGRIFFTERPGLVRVIITFAERKDTSCESIVQ